MQRWFGVAAFAIAAGGCGGGVDPAVVACEKAIAEQLTDRAYTLDRADMTRRLTRDGDRGQIESTVWFNKGLPNELAQTFTCQVLYDPTDARAEPAVTGLKFVW
jgi:hypothetical protein